MHPAVQRVVEAARAAGLDPAVSEFPTGTRTAEDAARAVGCDVAQIVKSLVFIADGRAVLALVSGRHRLDPSRLAAAAGAADVRRASPEEVRVATGFAVGGVPPLGHPGAIEVFVDRTLLAHELVWCAAGTPTTVFPVDPRALVRATGAREADLGDSAGPDDPPPA